MKDSPTVGIPPTEFLDTLLSVPDIESDEPGLMKQAWAVATGEYVDPDTADKPSPLAVPFELV